MEINGEFEVALDALRSSAERWLAQAEQVAAGLEDLRIRIEGADLGPEVSEAIALLIRVWGPAGAAITSDIAEHAASIQSSAHAYDDADSHAADSLQAATGRPPTLPAALEGKQ